MRKTVFAVLTLLAAVSLYAAGLSVESAETIPAGQLKATLSCDIGFFNRYYNNDGDYTDFTGNVAKSSFAIPVSLRYGMPGNMEIGLDTSYVISTFTLPSAAKITGNGFGDVSVSIKDSLMKDPNSSFSGKFGAVIPFGKNAFSVDAADYATSSNFLALSLAAEYTMKLMDGNFISANVGYSLPFGATITKVGGITIPNTTITPAGTIFYGVSDKHKLMNDLSAILEISGFIKGDGSAAFSTGGDATGAVILAASPMVVLNKQSAIYVKPAIEYKLTDKIDVTAGVSIATSLVNDYSALPANVFVAVSSIF